MNIILLRQFSLHLLALDSRQRHIALKEGHESGVIVLPWSLLIRGIFTAFRQIFRLIDLPEFGRPPLLPLVNGSSRSARGRLLPRAGSSSPNHVRRQAAFPSWST
jgi:hypothetical protein